MFASCLPKVSPKHTLAKQKSVKLTTQEDEVIFHAHSVRESSTQKTPMFKALKIDVTNAIHASLTHSDVSLMIHFRIKDSTDEVAATAFEDVITEITGQTKDDLLTLQNHFGTDVVMNKLDEIVDTEYYIHVKSTDYRDVNCQRTLTVLAMTPTGNSPQKRRTSNK